MEAKFWPGGYHAQGPNKYGYVCVTSDLGGNGMRLVIASMSIPHHGDVDNDDGSPMSVEQGTGYAVATAELFAAAPDLLEALEDIFAARTIFSPKDMAAAMEKADVKARAAIAKATGAR